MSEFPPCPKCKSQFTYSTGILMTCPECFHEWNPEEESAAAEAAVAASIIKDANGNPLQDGDTVVVIKDLPVKGSSKPVKAGTKVKNIKLVEGDHNIACKVDGFGAMGLKSEFVRKA
jgi:protein PhnA